MLPTILNHGRGGNKSVRGFRRKEGRDETVCSKVIKVDKSKNSQTELRAYLRFVVINLKTNQQDSGTAQVEFD